MVDWIQCLVIEKDPDAVLDYTFDWSAWLVSDTISSSTWTVPSGITPDSDSNDTTTATIILSGGTVGNKYTVLNRIVTAAGLTEDRSVVFYIKEK